MVVREGVRGLEIPQTSSPARGPAPTGYEVRSIIVKVTRHELAGAR